MLLKTLLLSVFLPSWSRVGHFINWQQGNVLPAWFALTILFGFQSNVSTLCQVWEAVTHQKRGYHSKCVSRVLQDDWGTSHLGLVPFSPSLVLFWIFTWPLAPKENQSVEYSNIKLIPLCTSGQASFYWKHRLEPAGKWGWGEERLSLKGKGKLLFSLIVSFITLFHSPWSLCINRLRTYFSENSLILINLCSEFSSFLLQHHLHGPLDLREGPDPWPSDSQVTFCT